MDISKSKFFIGGDTNDLYKDFIFTWMEHHGVATNKWTMNKIIAKTRSLESKSTGQSIDSGDEEDFGSDINGYFLERYDPALKKISEYLSNNTIEELKANPMYKHLGARQLKDVILTKISVMIYLHAKLFFINYGDFLNIDDSLKCRNGTPVIEAIKMDIERIKNEIATEIKKLFDDYPAIKSEIDFHDILRAPRANHVTTVSYKLLENGVFKSEDERLKFKARITNIRSLYLDDNFKIHRDDMFYIYEAISQSAYNNRKDKIPGIIRGMMSDTSYYSIQSNYLNADNLLD